MLRRTPPCSVNLKALDNRFFRICCRRLESVIMLRSSRGSTWVSKVSLRLSASWRNGRATMSSRLLKNTSSASTETVPDSILDRSRMSVMRLSRSEEHTSELQSQSNLVCRLLLEKKKKKHEIK